MRKTKKEDYFGTSVKRYYQMTNHTLGTKETWGVEGVIYLNLKDIESEEMLFRVAAEEAAHLLDDGEEVKEEMYQYLKKEMSK